MRSPATFDFESIHRKRRETVMGLFFPGNWTVGPVSAEGKSFWVCPYLKV
jgi:hypothetical protein